MHARLWLLASAASLLVVLPLDGPTTLAQSQAALTGVVSSAEEPAMEGVLVTVKQAGSKRATTVITGSDGRYQFPRTRLEPGTYAVSIRAVGFDLASEPTVSIAASGTTTANLTLRKAHNLASQLTNSEWLASFPGTDQQRASVRGCAHCHTMGLVTNSKHDAESFTKVVERMSGYPPLAFPLMPQRTPAPRIGPGAVSREQQLQGWRQQAEYLSTLNLGDGRTSWNYAFKTFPRPTGAATRVIYTEYDLPARTRQPHDVIVDRSGTVWYAAFGEQIIGKMDPATGKITEFTVPTLKPAAPKGILGMRFDEDENLWLALQFQGGVAKFDTKTEKFQVWSLPPHLNGDHVQINQISPDRHKVDGKVWFQDAGTYTVLRLDVKSGQHRGLRAVRDPAAQRLRRDPGQAEQRLVPAARRRGSGPHRREDRRHHQVQDADQGVRAAARHDGRRGAPVVRREPRRQDRHVRHQDAAVQGMAAADAGVALRRHRRSQRRGVVGQRIQRPHRAPEPGHRPDDRVPAAASDQRAAGVGGQPDHAGHVLGRQQPRRVDRQA